MKQLCAEDGQGPETKKAPHRCGAFVATLTLAARAAVADFTTGPRPPRSRLDLEHLIRILKNLKDHVGPDALDHAGPIEHLARFEV